jgi:hypothetical protein
MKRPPLARCASIVPARRREKPENFYLFVLKSDSAERTDAGEGI